MSGIKAIKFTPLEQKYLERQSYASFTDVWAIMNYTDLKTGRHYKKKQQKARKGTLCSAY